MADKNPRLPQTGWSGLAHADIATYLDRTLNANEQATATSLIKSIETFIEGKCNRPFRVYSGSDSYAETFNIDGFEYFLIGTPIASIVSISVGGTEVYNASNEVGSNTIELDDDFFLYDDYIEFDYMPSYNEARKGLVINYQITQFWDEDVLLAIKRFVAEKVSEMQYGGKTVNNLSQSGESVGFDAKDLPMYIKDIVSIYRKANI